MSPRPASFYIKNIIGLLLLLALSGVFLYSAIAKIYSLEAFEWTFIDIGINSMTGAGITARLFIGLELLIGGFLLCHLFLRQFTYPATIIMLVLLTAYLAMLLIQQGNEGSCGCFGDWLYMKPLAAIWKNLGMIAATVLLLFIYPFRQYKNQEWVAAVVGMAAIVLPFVLNPLTTNHQPTPMNKPVDMSVMYEHTPVPSVELRKGKHIVAFMSLTCPHCRKAAYLLKAIHQQNPELPIFIVLNGNIDQMDDFFKETHAIGVPHYFMKNTDGFIDLAGDSVPAIYWINNSVIERESNYFQLDPKDMKSWLNQ